MKDCLCMTICSLVEPSGFSCGIQHINYGVIQLRQSLRYCENKKQERCLCKIGGENGFSKESAK